MPCQQCEHGWLLIQEARDEHDHTLVLAVDYLDPCTCPTGQTWTEAFRDRDYAQPR